LLERAPGVAVLPVRPEWGRGPLSPTWQLAALSAPGVGAVKILATGTDGFMMGAGLRIESP